MKLWIRNLILRWLGLADHQARLVDLERQFVTRRNEVGDITETLADVPVEKRAELRKRKAAGMNWQQRKRWLEATDGGSRAAVTDRLPSNF